METQYKYSNKKEYMHNSGPIPIFELSDFKIINNDSSIVKNFNGLYFPVFYGVNYALLLNDYIGTFLKLKKDYPDLKIIFFTSKNLKNIVNKPGFEIASDDFIKYFNCELINIDTENYFFDKIIVTEGDLPVIPHQIYSGSQWRYNELSEPVKYWWCDSLKEIMNCFNKELFDNEEKKLYITRKFVNKIYHSKNDSWSIKRRHDILYDDFFENELIKNKYFIFDGNGEGFFKQINLSYNAKIFVSIEGSSFFNAIWCKDETPIVVIKVKDDYTFYHAELLKMLNKKNVIELDVSKMKPQDGINFIIKTINKIIE